MIVMLSKVETSNACITKLELLALVAKLVLVSIGTKTTKASTTKVAVVGLDLVTIGTIFVRLSKVETPRVPVVLLEMLVPATIGIV